MRTLISLSVSLCLFLVAAAAQANPNVYPASSHTGWAGNQFGLTRLTGPARNGQVSLVQDEDAPEHVAAPDADPAPAQIPGNDGYKPGDLTGAVGGDFYGLGACGYGGCDAPKGCCWYGSAAGLVMTRDDADKLWLTADSVNPTLVFLSNNDADYDWEGGFEVTVGRYISCDLAVEATYWTLGEFKGFASYRDVGNNIVTPIDVSNVWIGAVGGQTAALFFDGAREHRIWRRTEVHNVELNLVHQPLMMNCYSGLQVQLLAGARFFRMDEDFIFGSVQGGWEFGQLLWGGTVNGEDVHVQVERSDLRAQQQATEEQEPF